MLPFAMWLKILIKVFGSLGVFVNSKECFYFQKNADVSIFIELQDQLFGENAWLPSVSFGDFKSSC